jgi:hypothetical protein
MAVEEPAPPTGEALTAEPHRTRRVGSYRSFRLPA